PGGAARRRLPALGGRQTDDGQPIRQWSRGRHGGGDADRPPTGLAPGLPRVDGNGLLRPAVAAPRCPRARGHPPEALFHDRAAAEKAVVPACPRAGPSDAGEALRTGEVTDMGAARPLLPWTAT